jgi:hypothetical protein
LPKGKGWRGCVNQIEICGCAGGDRSDFGASIRVRGPTVLYSDNFQQANPAWQAIFNDNALNISGGYLQLAPPQGRSTGAAYQGSFFDNADACVDVLSPTVTNPNSGVAGIMFGYNPAGTNLDFYALLIGNSAI